MLLARELEVKAVRVIGRWKSSCESEAKAGSGLPQKVCIRVVSLGTKTYKAPIEGESSCGTGVSKQPELYRCLKSGCSAGE